MLKNIRLVRSFVLIDAQHGCKQSDRILLSALRRNAVSHQVVASKIDRVLFPGRKAVSESLLRSNVHLLLKSFDTIQEELDLIDCEGPNALGEIVGCSAEEALEHNKWLGINNLRWAILAATGFDAKSTALVS